MVDFYFHDPSWDQEFRSKNASVTLLDCTSWGPKVREDLVVITTFEAFEASQLFFFMMQLPWPIFFWFHFRQGLDFSFKSWDGGGKNLRFFVEKGEF